MRTSFEAAAIASPPAASAPASSRIIAAESLRGVAPFDLTELPGAPSEPSRRLTARDLSNETARAAYALGRRRGFDQGARLGLNQGYSEGSQALEDFRSRTAADAAVQMREVLGAFRAEMAALESQVASDLVSLAIDIARQVLRRELRQGAHALLPAACEALRALGENASQVELFLHPDAAAVLQAPLEGEAGCRIVADPALPPDGCRAEADTGVAEAGFETRWQAVMATLGRDEEPLP
ncbi:FliH/SctL family protein [Ramlibacter sp.]|uniref:FliH/SctL family protein n=1 Tax=Ramlibacter sp. TaxID=1917967 RepID=UPI003D11D39E